MKGLFIKDLELLKGNAKILVAAVLMAVFFMFTSATDVTFVMYYVTMMCGFLVLSTMSYDDFDNGMAYLMTLPVMRKTYVREKYVFGLGCVGAGWVVSALLSLAAKVIRNPAMEWGEWMISLFGTILAFGLIIAVMIPVQLKFGSENMRIVLLAVMLGIFAIGYLIYRVCKNFGVDFSGAIRFLDSLHAGVIIAAILVIAAILLAVSLKISERILENKEY